MNSDILSKRILGEQVILPRISEQTSGNQGKSHYTKDEQRGRQVFNDLVRMNSAAMQTPYNGNGNESMDQSVFARNYLLNMEGDSTSNAREAFLN